MIMLVVILARLKPVGSADLRAFGLLPPDHTFLDLRISLTGHCKLVAAGWRLLFGGCWFDIGSEELSRSPGEGLRSSGRSLREPWESLGWFQEGPSRCQDGP